MLDTKSTTTNAYFTGQLVPSEEKVKTLCEYFDVDIVTGTREFLNAHKEYDRKHDRTLVMSAKTKEKIEKAKKPEPKWDELNDEPTLVEKVSEAITERTDKIMEAVYKHVSYRDYCDLMRELFMDLNGTFDLKAWLYGKVKDFETYSSILKKLEE